MAINRRKFLNYSSVVLAVSLLPKRAFASAPTVITSFPTIINSSGHYVLESDHTVNVATHAAIEIQADDVTVDLQGHSITNTADSQTTRAVGVFAQDRARVTVQNGTLDGFHSGVYMHSSGFSWRHLIKDLTIENFTAVGIVVQGDSSVIKNNTLQTSVRSNTFRLQPHGNCAPCSMGIALSNSQGSFIFNNNIDLSTTSSDLSVGIYLGRNSSHLVVVSNQITDVDLGIVVDNPRGANAEVRDTISSGVTRSLVGAVDIGNNN